MEVWFIKPFKQFAKNTGGDIVNEMIPSGQFLLIDETGNKLGLFERNQVLSMTEDMMC
jgi:translation initiation factor IF-3